VEDLCPVKLKLDENLSRHLKVPLALEGFDVDTAEAEGLAGRPDTEVAACAKSADRVLLTLDVEFADLRKFPLGTHPGVVLFRPRSLSPGVVNAFVLEFVRSSGLAGIEGCVVVVDRNRVRIRRPVL
jgi:predicted nuclease of predicted toxin-antitoxin system